MSKLVKCKACGKEIAKSAKCPGCGKDNRNFFAKHKILTAILAILIIAGIGGIFGSSGYDIKKVDSNESSKVESNENKDEKETKKEEETKTEQQDSRNFAVGETAEKSESYRISVNSLTEYKSDNEFMQAPEGKKYVVANVTVENLNGSEDMAVSSLMHFNLLSLDGVKYDIALTDAGSQLDGTVAPGRKLTGNLSYEVPSDLTEAELEVNLDLFSGKAIYFKGSIGQ